MPFFSVVITVYNKAEFIKNTINSVLNQTFQDFEIIVVNDGSTDESKSIIKSFNDNRIELITTKNQGVSAARNKGIEVANANYVALLDGDDLWEKDFLKFIKEAITKFSNVSVFTTALAHKYEHKVVPATYNFKQRNTYEIRDFFKSSLDHTILTSSSIVFRKNIIEKIGYFDTSIESGEDTDFWIRIGIHFKVVFINKILVYYNFVPESISNTVFSVKNKPRYDKYFKEEQQDKHLKIYIDRNRFPLAILSKLERDKESFKYYKSYINRNNLRLSQKIILNSPRWFIRLLLRIKSLKGEKLYYPLT
ncbi:glycosyltransferase family 2 protein [Winogradskyella algicola]|uniref:glycosyltransferase family 2 protein n=1 Tax=Winogradskyella algicola TaxID=2575815 RepID=UPI0011086A7C|nr:glycosyltransferase [Winogradskyella algicola]